MKRSWIALGLLGLLACLAACRPLLGDPATPDAARLLFKDDFSDPASGWVASTDRGASGAYADGVYADGVYADGVYQLSVSQANLDLWATPGLELADVSLEVDAIKTGGDRDNRFGLVCRMVDPAHYYVFLISSDGYYGIGKIQANQARLLGSEAMLPSEKIPRGSAYLHLRADCVQDRLALYVNGEKISEVRDSEYPRGDVGLTAGAYTPAGTQILFDNFRVAKP